MADIRTIWSPELQGGDWAIVDGALDNTHDLATAVFLSLFTDRRADDDDELPDRSQDRRGWWGDAFNPAEPMGSKLWLIDREKSIETVRVRCERYAIEALAWMLRDGVADRVDVRATIGGTTPDRISLEVQIWRDGASLLESRFGDLWGELSA